MILRRLFLQLPKLLGLSRPPAAAVNPVRHRQAVEPSSPPEPQRRGRPLSPALLRTIEVLAKKPSVSPAEIAKLLSVSQSYARTLLRRARSRDFLGSSPAAQPRTIPAAPVPAFAASAVAIPAAVADRELTATVTQLAARLGQAEDTIDNLRRVRPQSKASWDVNSRAEVIRRSLGGESPGQIASDLGIPSGEVVFVLKIHRLSVNPADKNIL